MTDKASVELEVKANKNKDNYYDNIAYIANAMGYVKFIAIVIIALWGLSVGGVLTLAFLLSSAPLL